MKSFITYFPTLIKRELTIAHRSTSAWLEPFAFFSLILFIFPLVTSTERAVLENIAPGILWMAALLAGALSVERLLVTDYTDGSLEQLMCSPLPLSLVVFTKALTHWLTTGVPLSLVAPLYGYLWFASGDTIFVTVAALLLGTWLISLFGLLGVALSINIRRGRLLLTLLSLPFYIPGIIFGSTAMAMASQGFDAGGALALLAALVLMAVVLLPYATAATLRIMLD